MADDGRRAGLPGHAALAQVAARGAPRRACARSDREPRRSGSTPSTKRSWPTRSDSRCSWYSIRWLPPSGSPSCCTTCSPCPSTRSLPSSGAPRPRQGSSPAAPAAGCRERLVPDADLARQREVVDAFLAAARGGDFDALLTVLDPDVVLRADGGAVPAGASRGSAVRGRWPRGRSPSRGLLSSYDRCS